MRGQHGDDELKDIQPSWKTVLFTILIAIIVLVLAQWSVRE